ncbi:flagellar hook-length control protein FliK [Sulfurimonas sp. SAG-AH-194-L11]|nr:flagellar hook-length control protein FliK [Sulfurimonas sp. SAG-AH-194-L11]MDF1876293.1 flagellar hook-length control protein FliK [Sulfurimonas sp. SAG-AH-194-L11]
MISLESKTQTSTPSSALSLAPQEEEGELRVSFSDLLHGVSVKKDDKLIKNITLGADVESAEETKSLKSSSLLALLKGEKKEETKLALELNPELTKNLTSSELKVLVQDAKEYLKNKIVTSEGFKKAEIQALPKTLKGLVQVAEKFGIDISKITLEDVKQTTTPLTKPTQDLLSSIAPPKEKGISSEPRVQVKLADTVAVNVDKVSKETRDKIATRVDIKAESTTEQVLKDTKVTPLFKAQVSKEISTEQLVNTKITTLEVNTPKKRTNETLKLLLCGESVTKTDKGFTADFSVATARVLAPQVSQAPTNIANSLESLLKGEKGENPQTPKLEGLNLTKADSFEIKLNEAKQMTKYLSQDVKTAIEDYKSPFTRIKVQLNPQRLGTVELTVVQRGKNLHINLSSNNAAINALALNANDLKMQLNNSGINNASLNFNNNSQSSEQGSFGQQQQHSQQRKEAKEEYNYFTNEEKNEEVLNSLEIVVPNYA